MLVLRKDQQERVGSQVRADFFERKARLRLAPDPEPNGWNLVAACDHDIGKPELAIELERARVYHECTRGRARFGGLVDDAYLGPELRQPQGQDQAGRARTDDQNVMAHNGYPPEDHRLLRALDRQLGCDARGPAKLPFADRSHLNACCARRFRWPDPRTLERLPSTYRWNDSPSNWITRVRLSDSMCWQVKHAPF